MVGHFDARPDTASAPVLTGHRVRVLARGHTRDPRMLPVHLGWGS